jgi:hypothetical protein
MTMYKFIITTAACLFCVGGLFGQLQIERDVIASSGGIFTTDALSASSTVGEVATLTFSAENNQLTQGFQQSGDVISATIDLGAGVGVELFPNPAAEFATLQIETEINLDLRFELVDISGRLISSQKQQLPATTYRHKIDLRKLPAGTYFVRIVASRGSVLKTLKLVHI